MYNTVNSKACVFNLRRDYDWKIEFIEARFKHFGKTNRATSSSPRVDGLAVNVDNNRRLVVNLAESQCELSAADVTNKSP